MKSAKSLAPAQSAKTESARARTADAYHQHVKLVAFILRSFRFPQSETEELTQEVFLSFYRNCLHINPETQKAWLCAAAKNLAIDVLRKQKRRTEVPLTSEACSRESLTRTQKRMNERKEVYERALADSAGQPLSIMRDYYVRDKPVARIAVERDLKVSSVTSALHRQRKVFSSLLRSLMGESEG